MKTGKILGSTFKNEWKGPNGTVFYHEVEIEGDGKWQIGSKDKNPAFLAAGQTLNYEVKDEAKRSITKAKEFAPGGGFGAGGKFDSAGVTVGNALTNAVTLIAHGKVELKDLESTTRRIVEIAFKLKDEFAGR